MEDELWMRKIKERLEDYSEPLPVSGWERLERDLPVSKPSITEKRHVIPFRRWAVTAAAVLLVAVSSVSLWLLQSPVGDEMRSTAMPPLAVAPDILPEQQLPAIQTEAPEPVYHAREKSSQRGVSGNSLMAQQMMMTKEKTEEAQPLTVDDDEAMENIQTNDVPVAVERQEEAVDTQQGRSEEKRVERYRPSSREKLQLPIKKKSSSESRGWSVGLSVGNTGGLISGNDMEVGDMAQDSPVFDGASGVRIDLANMANGILNVPEGQELVFKNGIPYLQKSADQIVDIKHKQPLSFGFSVRKGLAKGFSVETGLTYTYLASDVKFERSTEMVSQKLHYLGIPLRANWNFIDRKAFTMYVSAGGVMEKCVYGKIGSNEETVKPLQFSVMGAVGAQYNISNRVGIYLEPGISYFFDDGSEVQTIRKENPCNFTLQAGIRLTY